MKRLNSNFDRRVILAVIVFIAARFPTFRSGGSSSSPGPASTNALLKSAIANEFAPPTSDRRKLDHLFGSLPMPFEANVGQADRRVKFLSRGVVSDLLLGSNEAMLRLRRSGSAISFKFIGATTGVEMKGLDQLPGHRNYFLGNERSKWLTDVPLFGKVSYADIYPGISLTYYGNHHEVEYDFDVAPGADPRTIRLQVEGRVRLQLSADGELILWAQGATIDRKSTRLN